MSDNYHNAYPECVNRLIDELAKMPGIGRRSAERLAFHLLKSEPAAAMRLSKAIADVKQSVRQCSICYNLTERDPCRICSNETRDASLIMVVEQPRDLISLEQTSMYKGIYHVLMGRLDALAGVGPEDITVDDLLQRVRDPKRNARGVAIAEVVLGLNPNFEGDTTALYLAEQLTALGVTVSRLARGLPTGSQLEYASRAVLGDAIAGRQPMQ